MSDEITPQVFRSHCHHGVAVYMYRCGKCESEQLTRDSHRMLAEAFDRLAEVLTKLEARL